MAGQHHWCNKHELGQTLGDGTGQGGLACCIPCSHEELDTTGRLNNNIYCLFRNHQQKKTGEKKCIQESWSPTDLGPCQWNRSRSQLRKIPCPQKSQMKQNLSIEISEFPRNSDCYVLCIHRSSKWVFINLFGPWVRHVGLTCLFFFFSPLKTANRRRKILTWHKA